MSGREGTHVVGLTCTQTVARELVRTALDALDDLPDDVDRLLGARNVDLRVCRRWTEIWPDWDPRQSNPPRGYGDDSTWAAGRDPDGDGWNTGKWWSGGPAYGDVEQGPDVKVQYDPESGTFQFAADVDEEEAAPAEQQELL